MKPRSLLLLACVLWAGPVSAQWVEGQRIGVSNDNAKRPLAVFVRWDGAGTVPNRAIPARQWVTIDLTNGPQWIVNGDPETYQPNLPHDAKAIFLSGILVITHPSDGRAVICDLTANFRAPGSNLPHDSYQMQTIEASSGNGMRSNAAVWVPVKDRQFEMYWSFTEGCPSLINLSLQAYLR
jgi:hypothetical protein